MQETGNGPEKVAIIPEGNGCQSPWAGVLVVMRHSVRVDDDDTATWEDKEERPYDTPISDLELPAYQAAELAKHGLGTFDLIICSPFRRCLETAAIVAGTLDDTTRIVLDRRLGEKSHSVRSCQKTVWKDRRPADGVVAHLCPEAQLAILQAHSGGRLRAIESIQGEIPPPSEEASAGTQRFVDELRRLRDTRCRIGEKVLVVAHGDTVDGAVRAFTDETVYVAEECCWVAFSFGQAGIPTKIAANRLESMVMGT